MSDAPFRVEESPNCFAILHRDLHRPSALFNRQDFADAHQRAQTAHYGPSRTPLPVGTWGHMQHMASLYTRITRV